MKKNLLQNKNIIVTFTNGDTAGYTTAILNLLITDKTVLNIVDADTGELIYYKK